MFGLVVIAAATIALTRLSGSTSYVVTSAILAVRGIGLGCAMMPATAAAYTTVSLAAVPQATTVLNVFQRVGGAIGTALLAVVLESRIKAALPNTAGIGGGAVEPLPPPIRESVAAPLAHAFTHTFWWSAVLTAVALAPAIVLAIKAPRGASAGNRDGRRRAVGILRRRSPSATSGRSG